MNESGETSTLTCPHCGHKQRETMVTNACVYRYECAKCKADIKTKPSSCCVFCSYGDTPCPPERAGGGC